MGRVHVVDGRGLDAAVRAIQRQCVLFYESGTDRNADLQNPWHGAVTLYPDGTGGFVLEAYDTELRRWVPLGADGGGGAPVTDHGALTGLGDDDHPQYLTPGRGSVLYVNVEGDHVTGPITSTAASTPATQDALISKAYADGVIVTHKADTNPHPIYVTPAEILAGTSITVTRNADGTVLIAYSGGGGLDQATADLRYVNVAGDTMTGQLTLTGATGHVVASGNVQSGSQVNGKQCIGTQDAADRNWNTAQVLAQGSQVNGARLSMMNPGVIGMQLGVFGSNIIYAVTHTGTTQGRVDILPSLVDLMPTLVGRVPASVFQHDTGPEGEDFVTFDRDAFLLHLLERLEALEGSA